MKIIVESENGYFWIPFPQPSQTAFNAETCAEYEEPYVDFLNELKRNGDENLTEEQYIEKFYERTLIRPTEK